MDKDNEIRLMKVYNVKTTLYSTKAGRGYKVVHVVAADVVDAMNILDEYLKNHYEDYEVNDWWATNVDEVFEDVVCKFS